MTSEKKASWTAQGCAVIGIVTWVMVLVAVGLYGIAALISGLAVPATVYNIVREARSSGLTI